MRKPTRPMEEILKQMYQNHGVSKTGAWYDGTLKANRKPYGWRFVTTAQWAGLVARGLVTPGHRWHYLTPKGEMYAKKLFAEEERYEGF